MVTRNTTSKFCFNTMVNNEAHCIERMLNTVWPYIDYWVIQDNGSTDGTQDIIRNFFEEKGIPGFLYQLDWWEGHGVNRDHCIKTALAADHGCDWILRVDADEQLVIDENFDWSIFDDTSIQSFNVTTIDGGTQYYRTWLWNAKEPWAFYPDKAHETIYLDRDGIMEDFQRVSLPTGMRHILANDGMTWAQPMKFLKDALNLEVGNVPNRKVLEDDYHLWYIAKSYADCHDDVENFPYGEHHKIEYARRAMFYYKMYIYQVNPRYEKEGIVEFDGQEMGWYACFGIANLHRSLGEFDEAMNWYNRASEFCSDRNENLYALATLYEEMAQYHNMYNVTNLIANGRYNPFPNKVFLIMSHAYCDTSHLPHWLHIKAMRYLGMDYSQYRNLLVNDPSTPQWILDDING